MIEPIWIDDMAIDVQKVIQVALGQGGRVFPTIAGRLAFELFCRTTNPTQPGKGEIVAIQKASHLMSATRRHMMGDGKSQVALHHFPAGAHAVQRGKMLILHGWRSRTDFMAQMAATLASQGFDVFSLDLPGHGASSGRTLNVRLGVEAVQLAHQKFGPFTTIAGHSFGGVVAVNAVVGGIAGVPAVPTTRLAIIASPNSMPVLFDSVGCHFGLTKSAQSAMASRVKQVAGHPISNYIVSNQLRCFEGNVLIAHARDDREVPFANAEAMARAGSHVRLLAFDGLGHRRIISDTGVIEALGNFASGEALALAAE